MRGVEDFGGYGWKDGLGVNYKNGIDTSVWLENEDQLINPLDTNIDVYLLQDSKDISIFKIGISNSVFTRISSLNQDIYNKRLGHRFLLIDRFRLILRKDALFYESILLKFFKDSAVYRRSIFSGATEVFVSEYDHVTNIFSKVSDYGKHHKLE